MFKKDNAQSNTLVNAIKIARAVSIAERRLVLSTFVELIAKQMHTIISIDNPIVISTDANSLLLTFKSTKRMEWSVTLSDDQTTIEFNGYAMVQFDDDDILNRGDYTYVWLHEILIPISRQSMIGDHPNLLDDLLVVAAREAFDNILHTIKLYLPLFDEEIVLGLSKWYDASTL